MSDATQIPAHLAFATQVPVSALLVGHCVAFQPPGRAIWNIGVIARSHVARSTEAGQSAGYGTLVLRTGGGTFFLDVHESAIMLVVGLPTPASAELSIDPPKPPGVIEAERLSDLVRAAAKAQEVRHG